VKISFFPENHIRSDKLQIAIIFTVYNGQMVFVKNKGREGWEMPGGHREKGEDINVTASRELCEETGASKFIIKPLCDYSVSACDHTGYGRLFYADIFEREKINDAEVEEVKLLTEVPTNLMYPEVQRALLEKVFSLIEPEKKGSLPFGYLNR
jgi:8-oxo-dGTP diphosphatase